MKNDLIIVAGGSGTRMGASIPKQFLELDGLPIIMHTIKRFERYDANFSIIIALPKNEFERWYQLAEIHNFTKKCKIVVGGETRFNTVKNALEQIDNDSYTFVHDAVRPLVSQKTIHRCFETALKYGTSIPIVDVLESIRYVDENKHYPVARDKFKIVQTPQVFRSEILKKSYQQNFKSEYTDDASVVESSGYQIHIVEGNRENIKITTPFDLQIAEILIKNFEI